MSCDKSEKIKDAIKVLKDILRTQSEEVEAADTEPVASSDLPGPSTRRPSAQADNEASRPISACSKALETLRKLRQAEQVRNFEPYSEAQGRKRSSSSLSKETTPKRAKTAEWAHRFVCIVNKDATKVPSRVEKAFLEKEGLGETTISFPLDTTPSEFKKKLCAVFPPLLNSGGYELLHCIPNTKDLAVIPVTTSNPIANLQLNTGKGRIYIRPIQENLRTSEDYEEIEEEVSKLQS